jgi:hypothetical protein
VAADVLKRAVHLLKSKLDIRHIYLHLPAKFPGKNLSPVYSDLARLVRFDGVIFDADIAPKSAKFIQKLLSFVHPSLRYGVFGSTSRPFATDFVIATVDTKDSIVSNRARTAKLKGISADVYILSHNVYDIDDFSLTALNQRFQALDIQHYGFQLNTAPLTTVLQKINAPERNAPKTNGSASEAGG